MQFGYVKRLSHTVTAVEEDFLQYVRKVDGSNSSMSTIMRPLPKGQFHFIFA